MGAYEDLVNGIENTEARAAVLDLDRRRAALRGVYGQTDGDPRYTDSFKRDTQWEAYDREAPRIEAAGAKARELLEKTARGHEMAAKPRPHGESMIYSDPSRIVAAQNEAARIVRRLDRQADKAGKNPIGRPSPAEYLRDEYRRGMETGGVAGVAICDGAWRAADELGIDPDSYLAPLRTPEQDEQLDRARRYRQIADSVASSVPKPPRQRPASQIAGFAGSSPPKHKVGFGLASGGWPAQTKSGGRHWS